MAMDNALVGNLNFAADAWLAGPVLDGLPGEGLLFLGYSYLAELAQRPEYRVMAETIADDATRNWIDFDVTGDEAKQAEERKKDPQGYDERMADPDEQKKRVAAGGKSDKVKELKDDQLRLGVKDRYYEQVRNDGFFGRSHNFLDIREPGTDAIAPNELKMPIGDSRDQTSITKCQKGWFQGMRTIEPVWTYPLMYNAINPLREDWYNPQVWFVMGQEIHGSRLQTFVGHPVPDMLKPAYAFGGLSLTQMAKPYVDIWLQTRQSVAALIHSFSVMVLMTDISTLLQPGNAGNLLARVAMFNMLRDNQGTFVVNKNTEDFKNVSASLSGLHELQAQAQEHMAAVHRIPLVKFTGIQPAGLNACLTGDTLISTDRGQVPIRDVTIADRVMTRRGWAPLTFSGVTKYANELIEITTRTATLRCTGNHPIWIPSINAFVRAENVRRGDLLLSTGGKSATQSTRRPWLGAGSGGGGTSTAITSRGISPRSDWCISIAECGRRTAALFRMVFKSTTPTGTRKTIRSIILRRCMESFMPNFMASTLVFKESAEARLNPDVACIAQRRSSSKSRQAERSFAAEVARSQIDEQMHHPRQSLDRPVFASNVALLLRLFARMLSFARASAQLRAKIELLTAEPITEHTRKSGLADQVLSVRTIWASEPVYDLTVAPRHLPEFFANGILTHNSSEGEIKTYDDTIGALQSRLLDTPLRRVINFQQLSLWGEIDPEITHRWVPLREMTQAEKGTKEKDDADRNQKYVDMGAISSGEIRKIVIDDPDLPFTGLDPNDVPEPPAEEGLLGPGGAGAAKEEEAGHLGQPVDAD
jgi:hypothetical protein